MSVPLLARSALLGSSMREYAPAPAIATVAVCTWEGGTGSRGRVTVLPDGCADLMWDGTTLRVSGVQTAVVGQRVTSPYSVGIRLRPAALGPVLGASASVLPAGPVDLTDVWGREALRWSRRLASVAPARTRMTLEALVRARLAGGPGPDPQVAAAARRLDAPRAGVDDVARQVGLSARELRRRFLRDVGRSPKQVQRVLRFRRFVGSLGAVVECRTTMALAAADLGYADQAHVSRECRELSGRTPRQLAATWAAHAVR